MTTLAALKALLQSEVPAVNSVPTDAQYTQAVKDAAAEFSRRCGLMRIGELAIVSGTATYSLPADFLKLIWLEALTGVDGVIVSSGGLIPIGSDWKEEYTIANKQVTFYPTPQYTMAREYKYKSVWVLTGAAGSETYATMGDDEAQVVLLKAKAIATEKIYRAQASSGNMKYSLGAVSVDKGEGTNTLEKDMKDFADQFAEECDRYNGA